jgi:hypothetical protein
MDTYVLAYDAQQRRPACVLVAAAMGASTSAAKEFPSELWLVAPTSAMRLYKVSEQQLYIIVACTIGYHNSPPSSEET